MKISTGTITRTALLFLALLNQALTITGHSPLPIEDETLSELIALGATIITSLLAWWKNQSFTRPALLGDACMAEAKLKKSV